MYITRFIIIIIIIYIYMYMYYNILYIYIHYTYIYIYIYMTHAHTHTYIHVYMVYNTLCKYIILLHICNLICNYIYIYICMYIFVYTYQSTKTTAVFHFRLFWRLGCGFSTRWALDEWPCALYLEFRRLHLYLEAVFKAFYEIATLAARLDILLNAICKVPFCWDKWIIISSLWPH